MRRGETSCTLFGLLNDHQYVGPSLTKLLVNILYLECGIFDITYSKDIVYSYLSATDLRVMMKSVKLIFLS